MGTRWVEWVREQKARETPAQAELRRRFEEDARLGLSWEIIEHPGPDAMTVVPDRAGEEVLP